MDDETDQRIYHILKKQNQFLAVQLSQKCQLDTLEEVFLANALNRVPESRLEQARTELHGHIHELYLSKLTAALTEIEDIDVDLAAELQGIVNKVRGTNKELED